MTNEGICLDALETFTANKQTSLARITNCADTVRQKWLYDFKMQRIFQEASGNCLTAVPNLDNASQRSEQPNYVPNMKNDDSKFSVHTAACRESVQQKWMLLPFDWKWSAKIDSSFSQLNFQCNFTTLVQLTITYHINQMAMRSNMFWEAKILI